MKGTPEHKVLTGDNCTIGKKLHSSFKLCTHSTQWFWHNPTHCNTYIIPNWLHWTNNCCCFGLQRKMSKCIHFHAAIYIWKKQLHKLRQQITKNIINPSILTATISFPCLQARSAKLCPQLCRLILQNTILKPVE